jgi:hypothetical protein
MAVPDFPELPVLSPEQNLSFLDMMGRSIAPEKLVVTDALEAYDFGQIKFTPFGDMFYRGRILFPKEDFHNLAPQLQTIYYTYYAPTQEPDFTTYREPVVDSSSSSQDTVRLHSSGSDGSEPARDPNLDPALYSTPVDNTDASGLLGIPFSIDGTVPLSQAYMQYETRGFKMIADKPIPGPLAAVTRNSAIAADLSRKRKQVGFSREEIVMFGGLSCTPCRPSNLSDQMLTTLFRQENFYNTTQEVYDVITPALKLAERFITDPTLIGYWSTLAFGRRVIDQKLTAATGAANERIITSPSLTDDNRNATLNLINRMGKLVEFRFELDDDFANQRCFGKVLKSVRKWNLTPEYHAVMAKGFVWPDTMPFLFLPFAKDPWDDFQRVSLHPDFLTAARRFNATKNQDVAARLRFNFFFAVNIVHELAHVFEMKAGMAHFDTLASQCSSLEDFKQLMDPTRLSGSFEAYWGNEPWAEAGARWEWETFGGRVQPLGGRADALRGMMMFNADGVANLIRPLPSDMMVGVCIQMGFMEEVQQQSFWARPQRNLKFPATGARAYFSPVIEMIEISDFLRDRDAEYTAMVNSVDLVTDPADINMGQLLATALTELNSDDGNERPSKRPRLDNPSTTTTRVVRRPVKRGGLRQTLIRRFPSKLDAATKATRKDAMTREAHRLQDVGQIDNPAHDLLPGQRVIDDFFSYPGDDPQDVALPSGFASEPYIDPLTKLPADLTLDDKWKLAEEWVCLAMCWEPIEFQSQRFEHPTWRPAFPFDPTDPLSFKAEALTLLSTVRAANPGESWPERRAAEKALFEQKREMAARLSMMDELITYLGYSRIETHREYAASGKFPMGMTIHNFPAYKPLLDAFRLTHRLQTSGGYAQAVGLGMVNAGATGVGLIEVDKKGNPNPTLNPGPGEGTVKITDFFSRTTKTRPADARHSTDSASTASSLPSDLAPLSKVPTPEELLAKYNAWVAAGADMRSRPEGVLPTQLLSKGLGGSLQTVQPKDLVKVVEAREKRLEEEREERRREVRARAEAAERRRGEAGSGSGSRSGEGER